MIENMKVELGKPSDIDSWMQLVRKVNSYANNRAQVIKKQLPIIDNCNYDLQTGFRQLN